jgi:lipoyl(octanoyl) transferase
VGDPGERGVVTGAILEVVTAGLVPYVEALEWQHAIVQARLEGRVARDVLLLLEHPPVVTLGRSARAEHLLRPQGVDVVEVERGGDVTFHGTGQLVGYPILDLRAHRQDLHWYLRALEQALIAALGALGVPAEPRPGYTGVWTPAGRKLASIGVHVKQWVTSHGFALNVATDLAQFERIVPCGIAGVEMTSVERELERAVPWAVAVDAVARAFEATFGVRARPAGPEVAALRPMAGFATY